VIGDIAIANKNLYPNIPLIDERSKSVLDDQFGPSISNVWQAYLGFAIDSLCNFLRDSAPDYSCRGW
jgi:hypothetical protein